MSIITAEEAEAYYGPEKMRQIREEMYQPRTRLTIKDFEDRGIDLVQTLIDTVQLVTNPKDKVDCLLKMMRFVLPTISSVDIQHSITTDKKADAVINLEKIPTEKLVESLTASLVKERNGTATTATNSNPSEQPSPAASAENS